MFSGICLGEQNQLGQTLQTLVLRLSTVFHQTAAYICGSNFSTTQFCQQCMAAGSDNSLQQGHCNCQYFQTMTNPVLHRSTVLIFTLLSIFSSEIFAQKAGLEVTRTTAIDRAQPVLNVTVDAEGRKWAANSKGVYQVKAADLSTPRSMAAGEKNVLSHKGGNADFAWSDAAFKKIANTPCSVTAAWYDATTTTLWLGTDEAGLFQLKTQPQLELVQQYKTVNSKLKSNNITHIFQDRLNRLWVGTDKGLMYGPPGRWKSNFDGYNVQRVREYNSIIYVLADGDISKAPGGDKWSDLALDTKSLEGQIADFDIDPEGKMWILSGVLTRFDLLASTYDVFSGPEYYTSQYGSCVVVTAEGAAWVGTDDKGLYMVDKAYSMTLNAYVEQPISCEGNGKDAALVAKITGGLPPYTWAWSGGLTGENPRNVGAGTFSVTVTDSKGKARTAEVPVYDVRLKIKARQKKPESGPGQADGSAEVDIATNASGIQIKWDNGELMAVATKLTTGQHTVTVTDPKGCMQTVTVTIGEKILPLAVTIVEKVKIKCAGDKFGALAAEATGGKTPYRYQWSKADFTGEQPANVQAGEYQLTVTDAAGVTATAAVSVKSPERLVITATASALSTAGNSDGKAIAQAKGGAGVFSFQWDNNETTYTAAKLAAGTHTVIVTDANGCAATAEVKIEDKTDALAVTLREMRPIKCNGQKTNLILIASGGKMPYQSTKFSPNYTKSEDGVVAGEYSVTITDAGGASVTVSVVVTEPPPLTLNVQATAAASTGNSDGKATALPNSTSGTYTFKWDNGESGALASKLSPGKHTVTMTDASGCPATATVTISENILPLAVVISEKAKIKCAGERSAMLATQVSGGKGPFKYAWSSPALTGEQPNGVQAGDYQLTVTDAAGGTSTATVSVKQPEAVVATVTATAAASTSNADGKAMTQPKGGTAPYTTQWDSGETSLTATKLGVGQHTVTVTDASGCSTTATVSISENILPLAASISQKTKIKCAGEKTAALATQVSGGKGPFKYAWSSPALTGEQPTSVPAGEYQLTVTDATGKTSTAVVAVAQPEAIALTVQAQQPASTGNTDGKATAQPKGGAGGYIFQWDSGESGTSAVRLGPGQRSVTVTDANGCLAVATVAITENILPLVVSISEKTKIKCGGDKTGELATKVTGGKGPFKYGWSNPGFTGEQPSGVQAGDYQLTITDVAGTTSTASITVQQPGPLAVSATVQQPASTGKADGKATVEASGGTPPYTYKWNNAETVATAVKLGPGQHTVTVTDANGCSASVEVAITENIIALTASISEKTKIKCAGEKSALGVKVSGGKGPFNFAWNNPALTGSEPSGLDGGDYLVTVTDAKGTTQTASFTVKAPEPLVAVLARNIGATSAAKSDGKAQVSIKGGTAKFSVVWDTKQTGLTVPKLPLGPHSVTVTDANGCIQKIDFETQKRILPELTGVLEDGQTIRMRLLNFDTDSEVLKEESLPMLDELYDFMTEYQQVSIEIAGHTNNQPSEDFADKLSTARAKAVADYLFAKGVDTKRVVFKGYGKRYPLVANTSPEGRKTNQRVEIKILKVK